MVSDGVLPVSSFSTHEDKEELTLMTLNSFSEPLTPLMLSLWSSWTIIRKVRAERRHGEQKHRRAQVLRIRCLILILKDGDGS